MDTDRNTISREETRRMGWDGWSRNKKQHEKKKRPIRV